MILYHISPSYNDASIRARGILTEFSALPNKRIYLVERDMIEWAVGHVRNRHLVSDVTCWIVRANKRSCRNCFHRYWHTSRDVPPERIQGRLVVLANGKTLI